ncbi:hypothetical protein BaRGS_00039574 [Batillaria attramentaria]|uniref:Uncharacterized protein n=1 Tax=Batillaria attramentaria TaxID=370345 RepID=A0ABD0J2L4_9CAEN
MSPLAKIKFSFLVLGMMYFAGGIEYAVSMPKGWLYWHHHSHLSQAALGLFLSGYSIAAFFSAPVMGRLADKRCSSKRLLVVSGFLHLIGAVLDIVYQIPWLQSKVTPVLAILIGIRQLALILMPGVNYFLGGFDPEITLEQDNVTNIPALFLTGLWALVCLSTLLLYTDLSRLTLASFSTTHSRRNSLSTRQHSVRRSYSGSHPISVPTSRRSSRHHSSRVSLGRSSEMIEEAEKFIQQVAAESYGSFSIIDSPAIDSTQDDSDRNGSSAQQNSSDLHDQMSTSFNRSYESGKSCEAPAVAHGNLTVSLTLSSGNFDENSYVMRNSNPPESIEGRSTLRTISKEFIREDMVAVLIVIIAGFFAQVSFQVSILPLTEEFISGEELYSIILYCLAAAQLVIVLLSVWWCAGNVGDHHLVVIGAGFLIVSNTWLLVVRPLMDTATDEFGMNLAKVGVSVCLCVLGGPLVLVAATSLLTKLTPSLSQGLSQGVYHGCLTLAAVLAALWTGGTVSRPYLQHGVIIAMLVFSTVIVGCCYKKFARLQQQQGRAQAPVSQVREAPGAPSDEETRSGIDPGQAPAVGGSFEDDASSVFCDNAVDIEQSSNKERVAERQPLLS